MNEQDEQSSGESRAPVFVHDGNPWYRWLLIAQSIGLLGMSAWVLTLTFAAGERTRQMDINTDAIHELQVNGSPGLRGHLEEIDRRLARIETLLDDHVLNTDSKKR